jgi:hypothetical protein
MNNLASSPVVRRLLLLSAAAAASTLAACGGGSGNPTASLAPAPVSIVNSVAVTVDSGPAPLNEVNTPYVSVTMCAPGSNTQCQTIDHIEVDTGSTGFRVLASALGNGVVPSQLQQVTDSSGNALVECTQFVDGYSWGPVKQADLELGGETASGVPVQVIGDPAYPSSLIPASCINVPNAEEDSVAQFGANGVLGISNFIQDCGPYCAQTGQQDGSSYSVCSGSPATRCQPAAVALAAQVTNPVAAFASDNNGVLLRLPAVGDINMATLSGTLYFGIGTQADNALAGASVYALDPNFGTFLTQFAGTQLGSSFVDSGSNGYFFPDNAIATCVDQADFFCPTSPQLLTAQVQGQNGTASNVSFSVANGDQIPVVDTVAPDLAGPASSNTLQSFDWGLPFFYGRNVYIGFESSVIGGVIGPSVAF